MKILKVTFENINSLKGRHRIDFTHPDYAASNIFAITGPTGSGKSTILDAICLALYGKTPRQNAITQSANEIMSKGTGECFSELEFAVDDIRYLSRWSQGRAHRKKDGKLQSPKHEVSQLTDDNPQGDIIADGITKVKACIEKLTNLDFDRFTRSILLAQGEFDAFLNANSSEKGEILEQITGTQIYRDISKAVFEKNKALGSDVTIAEAQLGGITLLEAEELEEIEQELSAHKQEAEKLKEELEALREIQEKKQRVIDLQEQLTKQKQAQAELEKRISDFAPRKQLYERAEKALRLKGEYAALQKDEAAQDKLSQDIKAEREKQQLTREQLDKSEKDHQNASAKLKDAEGKDSIMKDSFRAARGLDIKIESKAEAHVKSLQELKTQTDQCKELQDAIKQLEKEVKKLEESQAGRLNYKEEHTADATLVHSLEALIGMMDRLEEERVNLKQLQDELARLDIDAKEQEKQKLERKWRGLEGKQNENTEAIKRLLDSEKELLHGKSRESIKAEEAALSQELRDLIPLQSYLKEKEKKLSQQQELQSEIELATKALSDLKAKVEVMEPKVEQLTEALEAQRLIRSLDAHRKDLQENQPCPLCGSTHHPYSQSIPAIQEDNLSSLQEELQRHQKELERKRESITKTQTESNLKQQNLSKLADELKELDESIAKLRPDTAQTLRSEGIEAERKQKEKTQQGLQKLIKELDELQSQKEELNSQKDQLLRERIDLSSEMSRTNYELTSQENKQKELTKQIKSHEQTINQLRDNLNERLHPFGQELSADTQMQELKDALTASKQAWQDNEQALQTLKEELKGKRIEHDNKAESLKEQQDKLTESEKQTEGLKKEKAELKKQRTQVLEATDVKLAEQEWEKELASRRDEESEAKQALEKTKSELQSSKERLGQIEKEHSRKAQELQAENERFLIQIQAQGFADLSAYTQALLDDAEFVELKNENDRLIKEKQRLSGVLEQTENDLGQAQVQDKDPRELDTVREDWESLGFRNDEVIRKQGECENRLQHDRDQHRKYAAKRMEITELKRQSKPWEKLNHLIGSADGRKYRTFAQGITFDLLIHYANRHLSKLNHRYQLKHRENDPLELDVIDLFQADQVRSINNLSGGESFLVSLALALGLSSMSSQNIKIGSLFLDEGFGSLDEDSLDLAISALSELKRDEEKLIGVISHVPAIRERITCQITVTSMTGGVSKLEGPGVN